MGGIQERLTVVSVTSTTLTFSGADGDSVCYIIISVEEKVCV